MLKRHGLARYRRLQRALASQKARGPEEQALLEKYRSTLLELNAATGSSGHEHGHEPPSSVVPVVPSAANVSASLAEDTPPKRRRLGEHLCGELSPSEEPATPCTSTHPGMSPAAAEMLARSSRKSPQPEMDMLLAASGAACTSEHPLAGPVLHQISAEPTEEAWAAAKEHVRELYDHIRQHRTLPKRSEPLYLHLNRNDLGGNLFPEVCDGLS